MSDVPAQASLRQACCFRPEPRCKHSPGLCIASATSGNLSCMASPVSLNMPMLWPPMNAEAFKAEQIFRKRQLFRESLQRVAECLESESEGSIRWGVLGSDLYAFGLLVLLLLAFVFVVVGSVRVSSVGCALVTFFTFHVSVLCLFIHQTLGSFFFMSLRSTLQRINSRTLKRSGCSWCALVLPPGWDASLLGKSVISFPGLKRSTCR